MQKLVRFARYWDMVANSGRFANTLPVILADAPFENFLAFSDWIYTNTDATHRIALDRLAGLVSKWLQEERGMEREAALALVSSDYAGDAKHKQSSSKPVAEKTTAKATPQRQSRHIAA
jgi:hypothetical protein